MPCFEGLLPEPYNSIILDMLFQLAAFMMFSKMRLHTEKTLASFDTSVVALGKAMRDFLTKVCAYFDTRELPKETESRKRRKHATLNNTVVELTPQSKTLNLNTPKLHRLGDYANAVREFGPLDTFSSVTVSAVVKRCTVRLS